MEGAKPKKKQTRKAPTFVLESSAREGLNGNGSINAALESNAAR